VSSVLAMTPLEGDQVLCCFTVTDSSCSPSCLTVLYVVVAMCLKLLIW